MSSTVAIGSTMVGRMGFGAMRLTGPGVWMDPPDRPIAVRVLKQAVELGIRFIDTADSYGPHTNEVLIRDALAPFPGDLVIATKGGMTRPAPNVWLNDASPQQLRTACEGSLVRLGLDCIPLYQLHAVDPKVPFVESVGALGDLQREGKIRWIGLSNVTIDQLKIAQGLVNVVSVQNRFNIIDRDSWAVIDECERLNIPFIPWYPFAAGQHLTGTLVERSKAVLDKISSSRGLTNAQVILAWMLSISRTTLLIPGTGSLTHLDENFQAASTRLSKLELDQLNALEL